MRSMTAVAAIALIGVAVVLALESPVFATGFARKHHALRHGGSQVTGMARHHPARYFRCRGGRFYRFLGGWGCDYDYYPYYLPRRH